MQISHYLCAIINECCMVDVGNIVEYLVLLTRAFARRFSLSEADAYRYLRRYGAIELAHEYYDVMHTQSFDDMVQSLATFCHRKGGDLI